MNVQVAVEKQPQKIDKYKEVKIDLEGHVQVAVEKQPQKTDTYKDEYEYEYILEADGKRLLVTGTHGGGLTPFDGAHVVCVDGGKQRSALTLLKFFLFSVIVFTILSCFTHIHV